MCDDCAVSIESIKTQSYMTCGVVLALLLLLLTVSIHCRRRIGVRKNEQGVSRGGRGACHSMGQWPQIMFTTVGNKNARK